MIVTVRLDDSNRIVLSRELRRAAGITRRQMLQVSATPGRIVLEVEPKPARVAKRGKLKLWTGQVPATPIEEAVEQVRHYERGPFWIAISEARRRGIMGGGIYDALHAS